MVGEGSTPAPAAAPPPQRRPRVREVSSRFMTPGPTPVQRSISVQRQRRHLDSETDENKVSETVRSLESPFAIRRTHSEKLGVGRNSPLKHNTVLANSQQSNSRCRSTAASPSTAAKLLQYSFSNKPPPTPPHESSSLADNNCTTSRSLPDLVPSRLLVEKNVPATPSPNLTNSIKLGVASSKTSAIPLPPVPKPAADAKKAKKVSSHQEDAHTLKLLYNHYLQWRFANAKAHNSMESQKRETEKNLYSLILKLSDLYETLKRKRIELAVLLRMKNLSSILEAQMPYLDNWSDLQETYLSSVSEATQALLNASLRVPVGGNVRVDVMELGEAMKSAVRTMETIVCHIQNHMPKVGLNEKNLEFGRLLIASHPLDGASISSPPPLEFLRRGAFKILQADEIESLVSEVAKVMGRESALIEESGELLCRLYASQVEECSLIGQHIQLHRCQS